jgi:hypothetical protein
LLLIFKGDSGLARGLYGFDWLELFVSQLNGGLYNCLDELEPFELVVVGLTEEPQKCKERILESDQLTLTG